MKAILVKTDGYSIDSQEFASKELARLAMAKEYTDSYPKDNDESFAEMSYLNDDDAILYNNGSDVFVWRIIEVDEAQPDDSMKSVTIMATEVTDIDRVITLNIHLMVDKQKYPDMDSVLDAINVASLEYCLTEAGKRVYEGNCNAFNYGDFDTYVPDSILSEYGIIKIGSTTGDINVDFNDQLVHEDDIFPEEPTGRPLTMEEIMRDILEQLESEVDSLNEPQAFILLDENRTLEIVEEQDGLCEEDYYYSVRLHCNDDELDEYEGTCGIIETFTTAKVSVEELKETVSQAIAASKQQKG